MVVGVSAGNGRVPSALPPILKNYTKAAIRTQPRDLIAWSSAYFNALMDGESPPVKDQLEFPLPDTSSGVSPGLLRVLHKKFKPLAEVSNAQFEDLCQAMGVKDWAIQGAWNAVPQEIGDDKRPWDKLLVKLTEQEVKGVSDTLALVMQSVSIDPITRRVPIGEALSYFDQIHGPDDSPEAETLHQEVTEYLKDVASYQDGYLTPGDLARPSCPINQIT